MKIKYEPKSASSEFAATLHTLRRLVFMDREREI
jgi:hypothetical protein